MAPVVTNATGDFVVPNVTPDTYTIEVAMPGFKALRRPGVAVSGGDRVGLGELTLSIGGTTETVTVTSEAPLIQSQSGERSFRVTTTEVENLPIGTGRNFASLTSLTPGVTGTTTRLGGGGQNNIMMDGVSTMDTGNNGQLLQMNPEAIAEVKVLTVWLPGGVWPLEWPADHRGDQERHQPVPRLGLRRHAQLGLELEFVGNRINGTPKAVDKQSDWGYTIGGPVGKPGGSNSCSSSMPTSIGRATRPTRCGSSASRRRRRRNGDFSASLDNNGAPIPDLRDAGWRRHRPGNRIPAASLYQNGPEHPESLSAAEHHPGARHLLQPRVPLADVQDPDLPAGRPRRLSGVVRRFG